jgi:hypothetical protein
MDEEERPRISTRVVHTIGTGHFGSAVPIDLSYEISSHGEMQLELEFLVRNRTRVCSRTSRRRTTVMRPRGR